MCVCAVFNLVLMLNFPQTVKFRLLLAVSVEMFWVVKYRSIVPEETRWTVDICWSVFLITCVKRGGRFCLILDVWVLLERSKLLSGFWQGEMMLVVRGRNQPGRKWFLKVFVKDGRTRVVSLLSRFQVQWQTWKTPKDHSLGEKCHLQDVNPPFVGPVRKDLRQWNSSLCISYSLEEKKDTISRG